jgi:ATP-dependent DNA ligase
VGTEAGDYVRLDGEIVALAPDGRSKFYDVMYLREWTHFIAIDVLFIDGEGLREQPLVARKRRLRRIMPRPEVNARLLYHDHIDGRGIALFDDVREKDLEGVVAKWKRGRYHSDAQTTSWFKIRNLDYSQIEGRREVFDARGQRGAIAERACGVVHQTLSASLTGTPPGRSPRLGPR